MLHTTLYDAILFILCIYLIKTYILKKNLSSKEKFIIEHSFPWIRIPIICIMTVGMLYIIGSDLLFWNSEYYDYAVSLQFIIFYFVAIVVIYQRYKYGPRTSRYMDETREGINGIIALFLIFLLMHIFS